MGIVRWAASGAAGLGLVGAGYAGLGLAGEDNTVRDEAGQVVEAGELGAFRVRVFDCINGSMEGLVESVEGVPCEGPHQLEVYHASNLALAEYPGEDAMVEAGEQRCLEAFEPFVGIAYEESVYGFSVLYPSEQSWEELDDREVLCMLGNVDGTPKTGSAKGSAR